MALLMNPSERHVTIHLVEVCPQKISPGMKRKDRLAAKCGIGGEKCAATQVDDGG